VHRDHGGDRCHQEGAVWHGSSIIRKIIRETVRIPQPYSHDRASEGKVRSQPRSSAKG
jgi:hypothetical protein